VSRVGAHIVGAASSPLPFRFVSSVESCSHPPDECSSYCQPFSFLCVNVPEALRTFVPLSVFCPPAQCSFGSVGYVGTTFMLASKHTPPFVASAISCHILRETRKSCQLVCLVAVMVNLRPWIFKTLRPLSLVCIACTSADGRTVSG